MEQQHTELPETVFTNPAYAGKHVVVIDGIVHVATTGDALAELIERLRAQFPDKQPIIGYVPKEDSLILIVWR